jgi:S-DNA-T family DNA segregation ATPase FtsK/SpoIIIE
MSIEILKIAQTSYSTSHEAYNQSKELLKKLGLQHWYQVARLAISRSMAESDAPPVSPDAKGSPIKGHQLFGDELSFNLLWIALITQNIRNTLKTGKEINLETFQESVRNHWHRGASLLANDWIESNNNYSKFLDILISRRATLEDFNDDGFDDEGAPPPKPVVPPKDRSQDLQKVLRQLQISGDVKGVTHGPRLSIYRVYLSDINHLSKLESKTDEIQLALGVKSVLISNANEPQTVYLQISRDSNTWMPVEGAHINDWIKNHGSDKVIPICVGVDVESNPYCFDLSTAPHLMVAGTTNSGKSVALHACILSLLYKFGVDKVRFLMIDPKRVELSMYGVLPNLEGNKVITEASEATSALADVLIEIDRRNQQFESKGLQNIVDANKVGLNLPYIVVVIEELADLIMQAKTSEENIVRIAQVGRSAGVHLILSTQRPDAKTFSGLLRSNTARIALSVQKATDSKIILDDMGAEKLLGNGDMLVKPQAGSIAIRLHGAFVKKLDITNCIKAVTK